MRYRRVMRYYQPFPAAIPLYGAGYPRVTHPSATQSLHLPPESFRHSASFDLHVLSTPPAFILSQDQTLKLKFFLQNLAWLISRFLLFRCPFHISWNIKGTVREPLGSFEILIEFSRLSYCSVINVHFVINLLKPFVYQSF